MKLKIPSFDRNNLLQEYLKYQGKIPKFVLKKLDLWEMNPLYGVDLNSPPRASGPSVPKRVYEIFDRFKGDFDQFFTAYDNAHDTKETIGLVRTILIPIIANWKTAVIEDMKSLSAADRVHQYGLTYLHEVAKSGHFLHS